jgi:mannose-6-phosphate isomerase
MNEPSSTGAGAFLLAPQFRERVWGGTRLLDADSPIGEAWIAFGNSVVDGGPVDGRTVAELVTDDPPGILGAEVAERYGNRFPLLIKLLDTADWLSVQVHPNDVQAAQLLGPGEWGKTEAWHVLEAAPGARGMVGLREGTKRDELRVAIERGREHELMSDLAFTAGETILVPAGTLHTIGPGVLLYEAQQASDATFRAHDWNRPAGADRPLHIEECIAVADPDAAPVVAARPDLTGTAVAVVAACRYFRLDLLQVETAPLTADTDGRSFQLLTAIEGSVELSAGRATIVLEPRQTALVAGNAGAYRLSSIGVGARLMRASVPA